MSFPVRNWDKMAPEQKQEIRQKAAELLNNLNEI
jgi:deoxyribodipyrimidine photolyase-related protein